MPRLLAALALPFALGLSLAADKPEDQAKEAALAFVKAAKAKDLDALLKTADLPFMGEDAGKPKVFEKPDDLKAYFKGRLEKLKPEEVPGIVIGVVPAETFTNAVKDPKQKELAERVVGKAGFVVFLGSKDQPEGILVVAIRDKKARVVGIVN